MSLGFQGPSSHFTIHGIEQVFREIHVQSETALFLVPLLPWVFRDQGDPALQHPCWSQYSSIRSRVAWAILMSPYLRPLGQSPPTCTKYEEASTSSTKITHCVIYDIVCDNFEKGDIMSVHQCPLVVACMCTLYAHCVPILWCTLVWIKASLRYLITSPRRKTIPKMETKWYRWHYEPGPFEPGPFECTPSKSTVMNAVQSNNHPQTPLEISSKNTWNNNELPINHKQP